MSVTPIQAGTALYVFGVVPAGAAGAGLGSSPVRVVTHEDVAALVRLVPLDEFGEEPLREHLNDRDWLEGTARAHEDVLDAALRETTVVPFRIATLYAAEEHLHDFLHERHAVLRELLDRFEGKIELGVKAYFDRSTLREGGKAESGRAYLLRRQAEETAAREADSFAIECARASHELLANVAVDARANPAQSAELSGRTEQMLLNGAYLVPREDSRLRAAVRDLEGRYGEHGVTYEVTGPWPPYNFVPHDLAGP